VKEGASVEPFEPSSRVEAGSGSPTWAELTAVPPSRGSGPRIGVFGLVFLVGILAIFAVVATIFITFNNQRGQVLFTTVDPNGGNSCVVTSKVTTISAGTHAWMVAVFKSPVKDEQITVEARRDGVYVWSYTWPVEVVRGGNCTWGEDLASYPAGTWTFTFTRNGALEERGTITIK
jgi:hypothetical protein